MDFRKIYKNVTLCLSSDGTAPRFILFLLIVCLALLEPLRGIIHQVLEPRRGSINARDNPIQKMNLGEVPLAQIKKLYFIRYYLTLIKF